MMSKKHFIAILSFCCVTLMATLADAQNVPADVTTFLSSNCYDCHEGSSAEAGLDLAKLPAEFAKTDVQTWIRIFDRVHEKEMPPKDYGAIEKNERVAFEKILGKWISNYQKANFEKLGRVRGRRLTNLQLERTLHDLLGIDIPLEKLMPEEQRVGGFTTIADGQSMSHFQLENHLIVVDAALDEAFRRAMSQKEDTWTREMDARTIARRNPKSRCREPEMLGGHAVTWNHGLVFYGRLPATTAREDGWYRMKLRAKGLKPSINDTVWCTVQSGKCISTAPLMSWVGSFEAKNEINEFEFEGWLQAGQMFEVRPGDIRLKRGRTAGGQVGAGEIGPQNVPGIAMEGLTLEKFHKGPNNDAIRKTLFRDLKVRLAKNPEQSRVVSEDPKADSELLINKFAHQAFRRRVPADSLQLYVDITHKLLDDKVPFHDAVRAGYRALLCSPRFLYFQEQPGQLDDFSIASRLSYFLWNRMPDYELLSLANKKQLRDPVVLRAQVERMLKDERGKELVKDLAHDWLELRLIDFTEPDRKLYPGFDLIVQNAMVEETHRYLQAMLDRNLNVSHLIDSNFSFLNSRLAAYYDIPGIKGDQFRQVKLKSSYHRGGLITHGSILKVTANGTTTSPVIRGVWISERILGLEIPPPPENVSAIEPDIRGAKSIREQLAKHKNDASCASCHIKMDPPGYALENYDPSGRWRDKYLKTQGRKRVPGIKVDASSRLPDGQRFSTIDDFQKLLVKRPEQISENMIGKLLAYGTGSPVQFTDREEVESMVSKLKDDRYGLRSIIESVVLSDVFLSK